MAKVRQNGAGRWVARAAASTEDYKSGIQSPRTDWAQATVAAAPIQAAAIQAAISRGSYAKGVAKAGSARWAAKAMSKGADRFSTGVADAKQDYETAITPYIQTIESTQLPARGPKGDPKNIDRVRVMASALRQKKLSMTGN